MKGKTNSKKGKEKPQKDGRYQAVYLGGTDGCVVCCMVQGAQVDQFAGARIGALVPLRHSHHF